MNLTTAAFRPQDEDELQTALHECTHVSPIGDCPEDPHGPIGDWEVSAVTNMRNMFAYLPSFNQDLSKWDVSRVTDMWFMFARCAAFNQGVSEWKVSKVTDMGYMFSGASAFNQDLSKWDVSAVANMAFMFYEASAFKRELCGVAWVNSKADKSDMFTDSLGSISSTACTTARPGYREGYG